MQYVPRYTTVEVMADKLRGRIPFGSSQHIGGKAADLDSVARILSQVEETLDLVLGQIYELPLARPHGILADIVESWAAGRLLGESFQTMPGEASDPSNSSMNFVTHAGYLMLALTAGHNIAIPIPGMPPQQNIPGISTPQPIFLEGETPRRAPPDTVNRNVTVLGIRKSLQNPLPGIDFGDTGRRDRALGSRRLEEW
jgi:hypothetical protein